MAPPAAASNIYSTTPAEPKSPVSYDALSDAQMKSDSAVYSTNDGNNTGIYGAGILF